MKYSISFFTFLALLGCNAKSSTDVVHSKAADRMEFYNEILDQVVREKYFIHCLDADEFLTQKYEKVVKRTLDTASYNKTIDSLMEVKKHSPNKCVLEYSEDMRIFYLRDDSVDLGVRTSIGLELRDTFITEHFVSEEASIIDTLSRKGQLSPKELSVSYLNIVPYVRNTNDPYRNGMGVLGFSKAYFNKDYKQAIVYYEFMCGSKCGKGEIIFAERKDGIWKIVKYRRVWDS